MKDHWRIYTTFMLLAAAFGSLCWLCCMKSEVSCYQVPSCILLMIASIAIATWLIYQQHRRDVAAESCAKQVEVADKETTRAQIQQSTADQRRAAEAKAQQMASFLKLVERLELQEGDDKRRKEIWAIVKNSMDGSPAGTDTLLEFMQSSENRMFEKINALEDQLKAIQKS